MAFVLLSSPNGRRETGERTAGVASAPPRPQEGGRGQEALAAEFERRCEVSAAITAGKLGSKKGALALEPRPLASYVDARCIVSQQSCLALLDAIEG